MKLFYGALIMSLIFTVAFIGCQNDAAQNNNEIINKDTSLNSNAAAGTYTDNPADSQPLKDKKTPGYDLLLQGLKQWDRRITSNNRLHHDGAVFYAYGHISITISFPFDRSQRNLITLQDIENIKNDFISIRIGNDDVSNAFALVVPETYNNTLQLIRIAGTGLPDGDVDLAVKIPESNETAAFQIKIQENPPFIEVDTPDKDSPEYWDAMHYNEYWIEPGKTHYFTFYFSYPYSLEAAREILSRNAGDVPWEIRQPDSNRLLLSISPRQEDIESKIYLSYTQITDVNGVNVWETSGTYQQIPVFRVVKKKSVALSESIKFKAWEPMEFLNVSPDNRYVVAYEWRSSENVPWNVYWLYNTKGEKIKRLSPTSLYNVPFWVKGSEYLYYMGDHKILSYEVKTGLETPVFEFSGEKHSPLFAYDKDSGRLAAVVAPILSYGDDTFVADMYLFSSIDDRNPVIIEKALKISVYDNVYSGRISFADKNTLSLKDCEGAEYNLDWNTGEVKPAKP